MTATPTPGDLSARLRGADVLHMRMLSEMARPVPGSPEGVAWLAAEAYREVAHAAIAALSALPAGGGAESSPEDRFEFFVQQAIAKSPEPLRELGEYLGEVLDEDKFPRADALLLQLATSFTTPPPDAAEAMRQVHFNGLRGLTPDGSAPPDAAVGDYESWAKQERQREDAKARLGVAVGAQGESTARQFDKTVLEPMRKDATPAAGKGVDALAEAVRGLRFDVYALTTPELRTAFDGKKSIAVVDPGTVAALKAALTRQPVAGDGVSELRKVAKRNLRSMIERGSDDKALMLKCLEELS